MGGVATHQQVPPQGQCYPGGQDSMLLILTVAAGALETAGCHQLADYVWGIRGVLHLGGEEDRGRGAQEGGRNGRECVPGGIADPIGGLWRIQEQTDDTTAKDTGKCEDAEGLALLPELIVGDWSLSEEVLGVRPVCREVRDGNWAVHSLAQVALGDLQRWKAPLLAHGTPGRGCEYGHCGAAAQIKALHHRID